MAFDASTGKVRVNLAPAPGFCIKSTAQKTVVCRISEQAGNAQATSPTLDGEPAVAPGTLLVAKGSKVFINIAWDANVPPPPEGNEEAIQRAMRGEEELDIAAESTWFVPVIVSEPRNDVDKGEHVCSGTPYHEAKIQASVVQDSVAGIVISYTLSHDTLLCDSGTPFTLLNDFRPVLPRHRFVDLLLTARLYSNSGQTLHRL